MFSQEDSLANHTLRQGKDLERKMSAISGRRCLEQFEKFSRPGLWAKTFAALLIGMEGWYSTRCKLTWKLKATRSHRFYFQLAPSMLPTEGIGFGLLPTPGAQEPGQMPKGSTNHGNYFKRPNGKKINSSINLLAKAGLLPTPTAISDVKGGCTRPNSKKQNATLAHSMHAAMNGEPGTTSQLNPRFVAEMMGYPPNWLELPFQNTEMKA